jgi:hypothetical protein
VDFGEILIHGWRAGGGGRGRNCAVERQSGLT